MTLSSRSYNKRFYNYWRSECCHSLIRGFICFNICYESLKKLYLLHKQQSKWRPNHITLTLHFHCSWRMFENWRLVVSSRPSDTTVRGGSEETGTAERHPQILRSSWYQHCHKWSLQRSTSNAWWGMHLRNVKRLWRENLNLIVCTTTLFLNFDI